MNTEIQTAVRPKSTTEAIVITGLFIALTLVATWFINIRLPIMGNGGLIHLGNVPLFLGAIIYGKRVGALAGALGMGMFDLISGWVVWAPFTFIIVGTMGYVIGLFVEKVKIKPILANTIGIAIALIIKVVGYYLAEGIIYGNWIMPIGSIPGNVMQILVAAVIVLPIVGRIKKLAQ